MSSRMLATPIRHLRDTNDPPSPRNLPTRNTSGWWETCRWRQRLGMGRTMGAQGPEMRPQGREEEEDTQTPSNAQVAFAEASRQDRRVRLISHSYRLKCFDPGPLVDRLSLRNSWNSPARGRGLATSSREPSLFREHLCTRLPLPTVNISSLFHHKKS